MGVIPSLHLSHLRAGPLKSGALKALPGVVRVVVGAKGRYEE